MKKIIIFILLNSLYLYSASTMKHSSYDKRIGTVVYNPNDVISVHVKEGFFTMIEFSKDEDIIDAKTGFDGGWVINKSGNTAYIMAKEYVTSIAKIAGTDKTVSKQIVVPTNKKDWHTNLFIRTNKHIYVFDLHLTYKNPHFKIKIMYNNDLNTKNAERKKDLKEEKERKKKKKREKIKKDLNRVSVPRNWDYYKKVNKNSKRLSPNYVYDDGKFTYFGFDRTKIMPAIFIREDGREYSVNSHVRKRGRYYVKIVHKTGKLFFLRSGKKLVGVLNAGENKNPLLEYGNTSNKKIKRVIK